MKQTPQDSTPREMTVATKYEWASVTPFGSADQHTDFTPNRIAIERSDGTVVRSRLHPAEHAEGKSVDAAWDALDRAYFNGYALWTYLTTPFLFAMQGFRSEEIAPWKEGTESWRGLRVTSPTEIASHRRRRTTFSDPANHSWKWRPTITGEKEISFARGRGRQSRSKTALEEEDD